MIDRQAFQHLQSMPGTKHRKFINNTAANGTTSLAVYETEVYVDNDGSYTETITLPSVAEARGITYTIRAVDYGGGVTIVDRDDSLEWSDLTVDADGEYVALFSTGRQWITLATDIS